ncbi:MAG: hypothetical protein IT558_01675 [Alphaproteobacteria bacterium]|nr:hypothetical protein [Alphaproteobacteria bacterium]
MKYALKSFGCRSSCSSSAKVVDGKLILSFPEALTPVLWQMDLEQAKASAIEVRENKDNGSFVLTLKTPRGEAVDVAPFSDRQQAVDALMAAARALESAHGKIRAPRAANEAGSPVDYARAPKPASAGKWIAGILAVFMLFVLFNIWGSLLPRQASLSQANPGPASASQASGGDIPASGMPVSADDYLNSTGTGQ